MFYSLKTNYWFLGFVFVLIGLVIFMSLSYFRTCSYYDNIPWAIMGAILVVLGIYYMPLKPRLMSEPFDKT